jgi:CRP-like cAMP-binding protein
LRGGAAPSIIGSMQDGPLDSARHAQLAEALAQVFGPLDAAALADVESKLHWISLAGGEMLFRQGDRGDDVYVVVNGRVRAIADDPDGRVRVLEESGRGAAIGELALLTGEPRAATIVAVRDSDLVRLPKAAFDELLHRHPQAMMQLARAAAVRLRRSSQRPARGGAAPITFALVPAGPGVPLNALARRLTAALGRFGEVLHVRSADVDRHARARRRAVRRRRRPARDDRRVAVGAGEGAPRRPEADDGWTPGPACACARPTACWSSGAPATTRRPARSRRRRSTWASRRDGISCCCRRTTAPDRRTPRAGSRTATSPRITTSASGAIATSTGSRDASAARRGRGAGRRRRQGIRAHRMFRALAEEGVDVDVVGGRASAR